MNDTRRCGAGRGRHHLVLIFNAGVASTGFLNRSFVRLPEAAQVSEAALVNPVEDRPAQHDTYQKVHRGCCSHLETSAQEIRLTKAPRRSSASRSHSARTCTSHVAARQGAGPRRAHRCFSPRCRNFWKTAVGSCLAALQDKRTCERCAAETQPSIEQSCNSL